MSPLARLCRMSKELLESLGNQSFQVHDSGFRGFPMSRIDEPVALTETVFLRMQTRVMITCISESGGCSYYCDVGIPFGADPEVELQDRLATLRSTWFSVHFTTATAEGVVE